MSKDYSSIVRLHRQGLSKNELATLDERSFNMNIVQKFFDSVYTERTPLLICNQCLPEKISEMFAIKACASIAERIS